MFEKIAEFIYTVLFKPKPLKVLINFLIKLILPKTIKRGSSVIVLNPNDPVVSGALAFGVYEKEETAFIKSHLKKDSLFIDIGANIGYYTALAMPVIGENGLIIALEPDPESYSYLTKTIKANKLNNVKSFKLAAAEKESEQSLFLSTDNRGDNRLYKFEMAENTIKVNTIPVDLLLEQLIIKPESYSVFVKIDIQGAEGKAIAGMEKIILNSKELVIVMEFWPKGLKAMNTDPELLLNKLEGWGIQLFELTNKELAPLSDKTSFINKYQGRKYTNIVGIKSKRNQ
jgi:FkbM family methyltransferase